MRIAIGTLKVIITLITIRQQSGIQTIEAHRLQLGFASFLHAGFSINILHHVLLFVQSMMTVTEATIINIVAAIIELNKAVDANTCTIVNVKVTLCAAHEVHWWRF